MPVATSNGAVTAPELCPPCFRFTSFISSSPLCSVQHHHAPFCFVAIVPLSVFVAIALSALVVCFGNCIIVLAATIRQNGSLAVQSRRLIEFGTALLSTAAHNHCRMHNPMRKG